MRRFPFVQLVIAIALAVVFASSTFAQGTWVDPSPHVQKLVRAAGEIRVEVLDWGGPGRSLILLSQLGQTAHIYDDWATSLARDHRVLAITRRGYGQSTSVTNDYSTERLARDVLAVIDAERLQKPIVVGHGLAGEELSWLGVNAPDRIGGLVYLDAAYDRTAIAEEGAIAARIPTPPPQPQDMSSVAAVVAWMSKGIGGRIPEAEVRQLAEVGSDGRVIGQRARASVQQAVRAQFTTVDPAAIRVPVLALYARRSSASELPGCQAPDRQSVREACSALYDWMTRQLDRSKALFASIPKARIADVPGASSFMFLSHPTQVSAALNAFASQNVH